ncbi:hypothetical protein BDN72DRAFT_845065, partial [Pluteus cervinus]
MSVAGAVIISAIAVCINPRSANNSKLITLDANLFIEDEGHPKSPHLAYFNFFNRDDLVFNEMGTYFITATLAGVGAALSNKTAGLEDVDYAAVGDIRSIIPAGGPDSVDPAQAPLLTVSGAVVASEIDYFDLAPEQYVSALRDCPRRPTFPVRCFIKDSKRWGSGSRKPRPMGGQYIMASGIFEAVVRNDEKKVIRFEMELTDLAYLGRSVLPVSSSQAGASAGSGSANGKGKDKAFSYATSPA